MTTPNLFQKAACCSIERQKFRQRRVLLYQEKERHKAQRQMGQDPYLDACAWLSASVLAENPSTGNVEQLARKSTTVRSTFIGSKWRGDRWHPHRSTIWANCSSR